MEDLAAGKAKPSEQDRDGPVGRVRLATQSHFRPKVSEHASEQSCHDRLR